MNMQNKRQLVIMMAMMWMAIAVQAADCFWKTNIGSGTWNWNDEPNWTPTAVGVPGVNDTAAFTLPQTEPFTVSLTNDVSTKLSLGTSDITKPVVVTFDLNGHTLTHTNGNFYAQKALDWTILNGTLWSHTTAGPLILGHNEIDYIPRITIGAGATYLYNSTSHIRVGNQCAGELVIQGGGKLITHPSSGGDAMRMGASTSAGYSNYTAKMTITGSGSVWSNLMGTVLLSLNQKSTAELNITDNGLLVHTGTTFAVANAATLNGANAFMNITSGGVFDARLSTGYTSIGNFGTGTVTVAGSGTKLLPPINEHLYMGNRENGAHGTLIIEDNGLVDKMEGDRSMMLGYRDNATGRVIVRDGGMLRWAGGFAGVNVGGGGTVAGSNGELTVTGANSRAIIGSFSIGQNRGNALVTVADGGTLEVFQPISLGRLITSSVSSHNGSAKLVVTGPESVLKKTNLTTDDLPNAKLNSTITLGIGGCGYTTWNDSGLTYASGYGPSGKALTIIEDGGLIDINGAIGVYSNSTLRIDGGHTQSGTIGLDTNAVFHAVLRQGDANSTALMTASGEARIWGATLVVERGADFTPVPGDVYTLITAGTLNATINRFSYDGALLQDGDLIKIDGATLKVGYTENDVTLTVRSVGTLITIM